MEKLGQTCPEAIFILKIIALSQKGLRSTFKSIINKGWCDDDFAAIDSPELKGLIPVQLRDDVTTKVAIFELKKFHLVEERSGEEHFEVHRLLQNIVLQNLSTKEEAELRIASSCMKMFVLYSDYLEDN